LDEFFSTLKNNQDRAFTASRFTPSGATVEGWSRETAFGTRWLHSTWRYTDLLFVSFAHCEKNSRDYKSHFFL